MSSTKTAIEWTDATWNPTTGCHHVSPGCTNCYAEALSLRFGYSAKPWTAQNAAENVVLHPERLTQPLRWREPRRIFVNSMSDLFHEQIPDDFIDRVFAAMALTGRHTYQVLTKRPDRMRAYLTTAGVAQRIGKFSNLGAILFTPGTLTPSGETMAIWHREGVPWPLPNVWLGVSVEDQRRADERIPVLIDTPAAIRFLSCEPLLGPLELRVGWLFSGFPAHIDRHGRGVGAEQSIHWVIVGGESGPRHRPFDPAWAESLRDQCNWAQVAFFFKQHGGRTPKAGGRLLDGLEWSEFPRVAVSA